MVSKALRAFPSQVPQLPPQTPKANETERRHDHENISQPSLQEGAQALIKAKISLTYRLIPYEIEIEANDQTDITYVLGEGFLVEAIEAIQNFIDDYLKTAEPS